jgi:hypothetical protein
MYTNRCIYKYVSHEYMYTKGYIYIDMIGTGIYIMNPHLSRSPRHTAALFNSCRGESTCSVEENQ